MRETFEKSFYEFLLEAIDDTLCSLGEPARKSIYFYLKKNFNLEKREIPLRIDDFESALFKIFGSGAKNLEILCMNNLHDKIHVICEWPVLEWVIPELTFQDYIKLMKRNVEHKKRPEGLDILTWNVMNELDPIALSPVSSSRR